MKIVDTAKIFTQDYLNELKAEGKQFYGQVLECKSDILIKGDVVSFEINDNVQVVKYDDKTEQQTSVIQFLIEQAILSDSRELDLWLAYLARQAGDEQLAIAIESGEYEQS